jgi:hypothetical protein
MAAPEEGKPDDLQFQLLWFDSGDKRELFSVLGRSSINADLEPSREARPEVIPKMFHDE